jgi:hypothetical protein
MSQATGPAGAVPPVTLASLIWGWGDPYAIGYGQDQWRAARRDGRAVLAAHTLAGLEAAIEADYRHRPVPRECDPPATGIGTDTDTDTDAGQDEPPGEDEGFLLAAMRTAFPAWTIEYSTHTHAWIAHTRKKTICENSAVLLCAALLLIERQARRASSDPGPGDGKLP